MTRDEIDLGYSKIDRKATYIARATQLVENHHRRICGPEDSKLYIPLEDIESLIGAVGQIIELNKLQIGGGYIHRMVYQGLMFISVSQEKFSPEIYPNRR